jgi:hypothetical protein
VQISPNPEVVPTVNAAAAEARTPEPESPAVWQVDGAVPAAVVLQELDERTELHFVRSDVEAPCAPRIFVETEVESQDGHRAQHNKIEIRVVQPESRTTDGGCPKAGRA